MRLTRNKGIYIVDHAKSVDIAESAPYKHRVGNKLGRNF